MLDKNDIEAIRTLLSDTESRIMSAMDEKIIQSEQRIMSTIDEKISQSGQRTSTRIDRLENNILRELDLVQSKTNRQLADLKNELAELKRRQRSSSPDDGSIYIRMIADLQRQIDEINDRTA